MALRHNHYDAAFEEYLRAARIPYVAVDEKRRSLLNDGSLKSMDFIVYSPAGSNLLVDVKGRKFPSGGAEGTHRWENWATADDLRSLVEWEQVFGGGFRAMLVFAYDVWDSRWADELEDPFLFRGRTYAFYGVWVEEYRREMRTRSRSWETVSLGNRTFRQLSMPVARILKPSLALSAG